MTFKTFLIYLVGTIPTATLAAYLTSCTDNTVDQERSAKGTCELIVKQSLNDPDSAEISYKDTTAYKPSKKTWKIHVYLRAKNAFNAKVPGVFECVLKDRDDSWEIISVDQI